MFNFTSRPRPITTVRRALIVQYVIVDGWSSAKAAATFGVSERLIDVWVADYCRHGMASLRHESGATLAGEIVEVAVSRPVRTAVRRALNMLRRLVVHDRPAPPAALRRSNEDGRGGA
jgi:Homeodomain-like domain